MKMLCILAAVAVLLCTSGCAHATPVTVDWTYPLYNAAPGCGTAVGDTAKDLSSFVLYAQLQGRTDSILVYQESAVGKQGRPGTATFDRLTQGQWNLWARVWNAAGRSSCWSNFITRVIYTTPGSPMLR